MIQLVAVNNPDRIIFVGEALVGNEAVDQLVKFDRALRDFSSASGTGQGRGIDGMLITKWDTVDDKVCNKPRFFALMHSIKFLFGLGWSCVVHDIRHWTADLLCRLWANLYGSKTTQGW